VLLGELLLVIFGKQVHAFVHVLLCLFVLPLLFQQFATDVLNGDCLFDHLLIQLPQLLLYVQISLLSGTDCTTSPRPLQLPSIGQIPHLFQPILL
jgi:hypothetical protein